MIVLPIGPDPVAAAAPASPRADTGITVIRLLALGFSPAERKLIQGVVTLTQRRNFRIELVDADTWTMADAFLLDGKDAKVAAWAGDQPLLRCKTVIWVDGPQAAAGGPTQLKHPVQWPALPALLQRALGMDVSDSARQPLSAH